MEAIDYPADFDAAVTAALAHPCFIDSRGNLYMLRDDGATVLVSGPEAGTNIQFQGCGTRQQIAWATAQERLFVHFNEKQQYIHAMLPRTRDSISLPVYRRSTLSVDSPSSAYLVHNTEDALYCLAVSPDGIRLRAKVEGNKGFGAWVEGDHLYVFGMRERIHKIVKPWFSGGEGFSLKYGTATLSRIDLSSGRVHIDSADDIKKALVASWKMDAGDSDDRYVKPLLEVWLDSANTTQGRVLIGGVMDERPPEFDDTSEEPNPSDFSGTAFYRWQEGRKLELLRLLRGVHYIGRMAGPEGELLYLVKQQDLRDEYKDRHFAMRVSPDMQSPLLPLAFDWAKGNVWTVKFEPYYEEGIGAIAAVTTQVRDTPLPHRRHLAMSDDGLAWRFVHRLPDQSQ